MGRMLGAFDDDNNLDRPDLNKCPDCGCFFAGNNCPICGKECPEEYRAGNRKPEKKRKDKMSKGAIYVDWYHKWWFIAIMMVIMPIVGIILLLTSPYEKWKKILFSVVAAVYLIWNSYGFTYIINKVTVMFDSPVDTSLSRTEYVEKCTDVSVEEFYRQADKYDGEFVKTVLVIEDKIFDYVGESAGKEYNVYYVCSDSENGKFKILIRDCIQEGTNNFVTGDKIAVYGEGDGNVSLEVYDDYDNYEILNHPCINVAYVDFTQ